MGVAVYGMERDQHNGGRAYRWGVQTVHHRRGVRLRMVNIGSTTAIDRFDRIGYPVCRVCGQSISPLSSERQREHFLQTHQERCGKPIIPVGFFADVVADILSLPACPDQTTAYSVLEALRFAAARVLDMHLDDLQILVIGHVDRDEVDGLCGIRCPAAQDFLIRSVIDLRRLPLWRKTWFKPVLRSAKIMHRLPANLPQWILPQIP